MGQRLHNHYKLTPELRVRAQEYLDGIGVRKITRAIPSKLGVVEVEVDEPPTVVGYALHCGVAKETIYEWAKEDPFISNSLTRVNEESERYLILHALTNRYDARFAQFLLSADHDKRAKSDLTTDGKAMTVTMVNFGDGDNLGKDADKDSVQLDS